MLLARKRIWARILAHFASWRRDPMNIWGLVGGLVLSFAGDSAGQLSPFCASAAAGCWLAGWAPWPALLGGVLGSLLAGRYGAMAVTGVYTLLGMLWLLWRGSAQRPDKLLLLAAAHLIILPFSHFGSLNQCMLGLAQASLSILSAPVLQRAVEGASALARRRLLSQAELGGLCALFAMLSMGAMKAAYGEVALGCAVAAFAALCAAGAAGVEAVAVAALLGAGALLGGAQLPFIGCLVLCTLCAALFSGHKWLMPAAFLGAAGLCAFYISGGEYMLLYTGLGAGGYLLVPNQILRILRRSARPKPQGEAARQLTQMRRQLQDAIQIMNRVAELLEVSGQSDGERFAGHQLWAIGAALTRLTTAQSSPPATNYSLSLGAAACPKAGSTQTGDSMALRDLPDSRLLLLSDGMGSGTMAHRESAAAVALLGDLLSIGVEADAALECVNRLLMLRCQEEMYATLDMLLFDPATAKARFFKQGAPPSYVLRGGKVHAIHAETLPVGILTEAVPVAPQESSLLRGDAVVMMTDGLFDALGQQLFASIIEGVGGANTAQDAADALLAYGTGSGPADDMSVIVARVM